MEKQIIAFCGTHKVGKSTLARWLSRYLGFRLVDDVGFVPTSKAKDLGEIGQILLTLRYLLKIYFFGSVVTSRTIYDQFAYAKVNGLRFSTFLIRRLIPLVRYKIVFYVPIEFSINGVDESYRQAVDRELRSILLEFFETPVEVRGTVLKRGVTVLRALKASGLRQFLRGDKMELRRG